jgi:hypothetical protein
MALVSFVAVRANGQATVQAARPGRSAARGRGPQPGTGLLAVRCGADGCRSQMALMIYG